MRIGVSRRRGSFPAWGFAALAVLALSRCGCPAPPPGAAPIPTGDNAVNCDCAIGLNDCGAGCCDFGTGPGTGAACTNNSCSTVGCCAPGTGDTGEPACSAMLFEPGTQCCDPETGGDGQPGCTHDTVRSVGNCSARTLSVCIPPNTTDVNAFCDQMCRTHAKSAAAGAGFFQADLLTCGILRARGIAVPKASGTGTTWADAMCLGTCSVTTAQQCNQDADCPANEACNSSCTPVTCAVDSTTGTDNFCFGTISGNCCNVVPPLCDGDSSTPICRPNLGDPPGLFTAYFSRAASGVLDPAQSTITVTLEDGTSVSTPVAGTVDFTGRPCPGAGCSVGVTLEAFVSDFTAQGATFSKMTISAGTASPALQLTPVGATLLGELDASNLTLTLQGSASQQAIEVCIPGTEICFSRNVGGTEALVSNPAPNTVKLAFDVNYVSRTFTMTTSTPFTFPRTSDTPGFTASLTFAGSIINQPPSAEVPPGQTVQCDSPTGGAVALDGRGSTDPDGQLLRYSWLQGREIVGTYVGHEALTTVSAPFSPPGPTTTRFTLQVGDTTGQVDTAPVDVTVIDTAPPEIEASMNPSCLWSPNHGMVLLRLGSEIVASASDTCSPSAPVVYIKSVQSDQPEDGLGDGTTAPDLQFGTAAVCLRSEREGTAKAREPRTYTITLAANDSSGNEATRAVTVVVPHDQGGTKCPKVPASLHVPDGDPACVKNLPGLTLAQAEPAESSAPAESAAPPEVGCSSGGGELAPWLLALFLLGAFVPRLRRRGAW